MRQSQRLLFPINKILKLSPTFHSFKDSITSNKIFDLVIVKKQTYYNNLSEFEAKKIQFFVLFITFKYKQNNLINYNR